MTFLIDEARLTFHQHLLAELLSRGKDGVPSNADKHSPASRQIASRLLDQLGVAKDGTRLAGQQAGRKFEEITHSFIRATFPLMARLRPGTWCTQLIQARNGVKEISRFDQYAHLLVLEQAAAQNPQLAVALGSDYVIAPDIIVYRTPEPDSVINTPLPLVSERTAHRSPLRAASGNGPVMHASISCKWTIRSDRSQNSRSEGLNLVRNRKGRTPHIAVVTGEPLPKRIASIALGTGDIDCVYHFALDELGIACAAVQDAESTELLEMMVQGKRLRDISDLPLDLAT